MLKPICVKCERFYRPKANGTVFVEMSPSNIKRPVLSGTAEREHWKPHALWMGDLWECEGCGNQVIVGVGKSPIAEHHQPDFAKQIESHGATIVVNDC